jgi:hypothetical protein
MVRSGLLIAIVVVVGQFALGQRRNVTLVIEGYPGEAAVTEVNGKPFVDLRALAHITNSTVTFEADRVALSLPCSGAPTAAGRSEEGFSREFMNAAIESIASMREWASTLAVAIQHGVSIGNAMAPYRGRAVDALRVASSAAVTQSDRSGLELLNHEFGNVDAWTGKLISARNSLSAANLAMSEDALRSDPIVQNIVRCGQFLGPMFASGTFQDDSSCR